MRFDTRAIYIFPLMAVAVLCVARSAHAGMSDTLDRMFTFREDQKPLLKPGSKTVPRVVKQPYMKSDEQDAWSSFYTRPDLEPQDYLSSSASKVMRPSQPEQSGWDMINERANANAAASFSNIAIGEPGQGPGVVGSTGEVGRKTIISEAVKDWRDTSDGSLRSRPGDYDYRAPVTDRPAKVDSNAVIGEPLADSRSALAADKKKIEPPAALKNDPRYTSFNDKGEVTGYKVQKGDTLSTVAEQGPIYGKKNLWPLIYSANRKVITGKSKSLKVGQELVIPRDYTPKQAAEAAKKGARSK